MKRHIILLVLLATAWTATAQSQTYRQRIEQDIQALYVSNNCLVHLMHDTCNYIAYRSADGNIPQRLVVVKNNRLTTTEEAKDKTIWVGTTAPSLELDITDGAMVLLKDKIVITEGHRIISMLLTSEMNKTDTCPTLSKTAQTRDWTGLSSYGPDDRMHVDFSYGWAILAQNSHFNVSKDAIDGLTSFGLVTTEKNFFIGFRSGYSIYMDHHFAAGIGVGYDLNLYSFADPYVTITTSGTNATLSTSSPNDDKTWNSHIMTYDLKLPFHFTFFPKCEHDFNIQLELTPLVNLYRTTIQQYEKNDGTTKYVGTQQSKAPIRLFNINTRLSFNYQLIGFFVETQLLPLWDEILVDETLLHRVPSGKFTPYHLAFGARLYI